MNHEQWGFVFSNEDCIQCHACEVACKSWRGVPPGIKWRRVINIWYGSYPDVTCSSVSVTCLHCVEPACVDACPTGAVTKRAADGLVLVDVEKCTGCQACLEACPYDAPQFGDDGAMQKCDMCRPGGPGGSNALQQAPPCVSTCPTQALVLRKMTLPQKKETEQFMGTLYEAGKR